MKLSERIKACRISAGLTQEQVAEAMQVSRQAVTKWENGSSAPSTENLFKLAQLFGTTVDLLLKKEGPTAESHTVIWKDPRLWISVILSFFYFVLVTPFEVSMYTPQIFQAFCILLNFWSVVWFCILLCMILRRQPVGEHAGMFSAALILTAIGNGIFCLFFWQCSLNIGVCAVLFVWVLVEKYREKQKKSENST